VYETGENQHAARIGGHNQPEIPGSRLSFVLSHDTTSMGRTIHVYI